MKTYLPKVDVQRRAWRVIDATRLVSITHAGKAGCL